MNRDEAIAVCRRAVGMSRSEDVVACLTETQKGATRFANSAITQNVSERKTQLALRVAFGRRRGEVVVNRFDDQTMRDAVSRAESIAQVTPEDGEHLPPVEPTDYAEVPGAESGTLQETPEARAEAVGGAMAAIGNGGLRAAGAYATGGGFHAFANSRGASGFQSFSEADIHATVMTGTSSGWAEEVSRSAGDVDAGRTIRRAAELAKLAENPIEVEPGDYRVLLAPPAVCELLAFVVFSADAKAADEGRSVFRDRIGTQICSPEIDVRSVLTDPACPGRPFDGEGAPLGDVTWIEKGRLNRLLTTRYWAGRTDRPHTPWPGTISMKGGEKSTEDLLAEMDRGLYVTRFWYTRFVDPMQLLITGMTRDALFLVEDGKIVAGVKHLRFNDSPLRVFSGVKALGRPEPAFMYMKARVPAMVTESFRFSSKTSF